MTRRGKTIISQKDRLSVEVHGNQVRLVAQLEGSGCKEYWLFDAKTARWVADALDDAARRMERVRA